MFVSSFEGDRLGQHDINLIPGFGIDTTPSQERKSATAPVRSPSSRSSV